MQTLKFLITKNCIFATFVLFRVYSTVTKAHSNLQPYQFWTLEISSKKNLVDYGGVTLWAAFTGKYQTEVLDEVESLLFLPIHRVCACLSCGLRIHKMKTHTKLWYAELDINSDRSSPLHSTEGIGSILTHLTLKNIINRNKISKTIMKTVKRKNWAKITQCLVHCLLHFIAFYLTFTSDA